jgi:hypothetical protein
MFKAFAISILLLSAVSMSGGLAYLCRPPQSHASGRKKFKPLVGMLLGFSVALALLSLALLRH